MGPLMSITDRPKPSQKQNRSRAIRGALYGSQFVDQPRIRKEADAVIAHLTTESKTLLEVGFDHGRRLHSMALCNPDWRFVGLEIRKHRVQQANERKARDGLSNLCVWRMDARTVFANVLMAKSIDIIDIFFPTPWTHSPHQSTRLLLQTGFLTDVRRALKPTGILRIKTDVQAYSSAIEHNAHAAMFEAIREPSDGWITPLCRQHSRREWRCAEDSIPVFSHLFRGQKRAE